MYYKNKADKSHYKFNYFRYIDRLLTLFDKKVPFPLAFATFIELVFLQKYQNVFLEIS